jgi:hypothetical protein
MGVLIAEYEIDSAKAIGEDWQNRLRGKGWAIAAMSLVAERHSQSAARAWRRKFSVCVILQTAPMAV